MAKNDYREEDRYLFVLPEFETEKVAEETEAQQSQAESFTANLDSAQSLTVTEANDGAVQASVDAGMDGGCDGGMDGGCDGGM